MMIHSILGFLNIKIRIEKSIINKALLKKYKSKLFDFNFLYLNETKVRIILKLLL